MKHKHSEVLHAFVDGIECEYWCNYNKVWRTFIGLTIFEMDIKVRIKPQPVIREEYLVFWKPGSWRDFPCQQEVPPSVNQFKLIYKDNVLEKVEIVK